jgi:hypothetical protein
MRLQIQENREKKRMLIIQVSIGRNPLRKEKWAHVIMKAKAHKTKSSIRSPVIVAASKRIRLIFGRNKRGKQRKTKQKEALELNKDIGRKYFSN